MSERYPLVWRNACLELLQAQRTELHASLGFKRMSWEPIRNKIMRRYEYDENGNFKRDDNRLVRQNFDSWAKGKILKDEKFALIDYYVRRQAITGEDSRAITILKKFRFLQEANILSTMYMRSSGIQKYLNGIFNELPWTIFVGNVSGAWFKSIVIRSKFEIDGIIGVTAAYLPVEIDELADGNFADVVFFEGFLLPLEIVKASSLKDISDRDIQICALKLIRPEFRGLTGLGYAEGEIRCAIPNVDETSDKIQESIVLDFPSTVLCPTISDIWEQQKSGGVLSFSRKTKNYPFGLPIFLQKMMANQVRLLPVQEYQEKIDSLFELSYKGYVM